jgi:hypothetical protein
MIIKILSFGEAVDGETPMSSLKPFAIVIDKLIEK